MPVQPTISHPGALALTGVEPLVEADPGTDIDEPPDSTFQRHSISKAREGEHKQSLLTKALHDDELFDLSQLEAARQRPSATSSASLASTAELTCDTGYTSPARTATPSPPPPALTYILNQATRPVTKTLEVVPARQRRISFACAEPPKGSKPAQTSNACAPVPERRPTIKFACPAKAQAPVDAKLEPERKTCIKFACTGKPQVRRLTEAPANPEPRTQLKLPEPIPVSNPTWASKYIAASRDLMYEGARFHEFASDEQQPDDWIIEDASVPKQRLTMSDVFQKEDAIRKLGKEALEDDLGDDEDEDEDECDDEEGNEDDGGDEDDEEDDGYDTDTENGFGDSDDEFDHAGDDLFEVDVPVWFPRQNPETRVSPGFEVYRPATSLESDSSVFSAANMQVIPTRRMQISRGQHNLLDTTDFVCGTFDEDRVAEDMYLTVVAARKRSKLHTIPQDIDPSFPTSGPEDEEDDDDVSKSDNHDSDEHVLVHGELEDLHHGQERPERRRGRSDIRSPRARLRSPPPKKHNSSPQHLERSPRPLFGGMSPRRLRSPPPAQALRSPCASPVHRAIGTACKPLAARPGLTITKSLPRHTGMFLKARRKATHQAKNGHARGAIDIVKGLEQKRQRRREKYLQKYCDRARKGQIPEKKPVPGQGVERMRELGLYMAGKLGPDYVLSI